MKNPIPYGFLLFVLLCGVPLQAQESGESVRIQGAIAEDVYAAGGTVDIVGTVDGDVILAGGRVTVGERVSGDVMAAGGTVMLQADVGDDVRVAGGDVTLSGTIGDDAVVAAGNVSLAPEARINGRVWLSGGRIEVAGTVGRELRAAGGRIVLSGRVNGDVELAGRHIRILDSAVIEGNLVYRSPQEADIASGAQIRGSISFEPVERHVGPMMAATAGIAVVVLASLVLTGGAFYLFFPRVVESAMTTVREEPWKCLGLGLAVFAATPLVIWLLLLTVIGWLPALVIGSLYWLLLLAGFLTGVFLVADLVWGRFARSEMSGAVRVVSFVFALMIVAMASLLPVLGALLLFVLMLLGAGVLKLNLYRAYARG